MTARTVFGYSVDASAIDWYGRCSTREAAIAEAPVFLELCPGDVFYVCRGEYASPSDHVPSAFHLKDWIVTAMEESLDDRNSMDDQGFDVKEGAFEELEAYLKTWSEKNLSARKWLLQGEPERIQFGSGVNGIAAGIEKESA